MTLIATPGASNANSYLTLAEAEAYFETRLPVPEWDDADSQEGLLIMATRTMEAMFSPSKRLYQVMPPGQSYYIIRPTWTGLRGTAVQSLAWPRSGMYDRNNDLIVDIAIVSNSIAAASVVTTATPHGLSTGGAIFISGVAGSVPDINGAQIVTVLSETTFSISVVVTTGGTGGSLATLPQALKDATAELAGQLAKNDSTVDNDAAVKGVTSIKAGSVGITFDKNVAVTKVIPDFVFDLLVPSWLTDEIYEPANRAFFEVASNPYYGGRRW